jgi:hypothetical protein
MKWFLARVEEGFAVICLNCAFRRFTSYYQTCLSRVILAGQRASNPPPPAQSVIVQAMKSDLTDSQISSFCFFSSDGPVFR